MWACCDSWILKYVFKLINSIMFGKSRKKILTNFSFCPLGWWLDHKCLGSLLLPGNLLFSFLGCEVVHSSEAYVIWSERALVAVDSLVPLLANFNGLPDSSWESVWENHITNWNEAKILDRCPPQPSSKKGQKRQKLLAFCLAFYLCECPYGEEVKAKPLAPPAKDLLHLSFTSGRLLYLSAQHLLSRSGLFLIDLAKSSLDKD